MKINKLNSMLILAVIAVLQCSTAFAFTLTVKNTTSFPIEIYMGYYTLLCRDVKWATVNPGDSYVDHSGACALDWIGARAQGFDAQAYTTGSIGYSGDGEWIVVFPNNLTLNDQTKDQFKVLEESTSNLGHIIEKGITDRFKDTKLTRAIDYGVRRAGLTAALNVAQGVLEGARQTAQGTLIASREVAKATLDAAKGFLDQVGKNVAVGVLEGSATAAKGILEGVKQGTVGIIQGGKYVITQGPLDWFDINKISWSESLEKLKSGVLGNASIAGSFNFPKAAVQNFSVSITIDTKQGVDALLTTLKPIIDTIADTLTKNVLNPIKDAASKIHDILAPSTAQPVSVPQIPASLTASLQASTQAAQTAALQAQNQINNLTAQTQAATDQIKQTLAIANANADTAHEGITSGQTPIPDKPALIITPPPTTKPVTQFTPVIPPPPMKQQITLPGGPVAATM